MQQLATKPKKETHSFSTIKRMLNSVLDAPLPFSKTYEKICDTEKHAMKKNYYDIMLHQLQLSDCHTQTRFLTVNVFCFYVHNNLLNMFHYLLSIKVLTGLLKTRN